MENTDNKIIVITNDVFNAGNYKDYLEYCKDMDIEPAEEGSEEYYEWLYREAQDNYDCDAYNLDNGQYADTLCVITGSVGAWDGRHEIMPVVCESVLKAIERCMPDCDNRTTAYLNKETGVIEVSVAHHDGNNYFEIRPFTEAGYEAYEKAKEDYEYGDAERFEFDTAWTEQFDANTLWG